MLAPSVVYVRWGSMWLKSASSRIVSVPPFDGEPLPVLLEEPPQAVAPRAMATAGAGGVDVRVLRVIRKLRSCTCSASVVRVGTHRPVLGAGRVSCARLEDRGRRGLRLRGG